MLRQQPSLAPHRSPGFMSCYVRTSPQNCNTLPTSPPARAGTKRSCCKHQNLLWLFIMKGQANDKHAICQTSARPAIHCQHAGANQLYPGAPVHSLMHTRLAIGCPCQRRLNALLHGRSWSNATHGCGVHESALRLSSPRTPDAPCCMSMSAPAKWQARSAWCWRHQHVVALTNTPSQHMQPSSLAQPGTGPAALTAMLPIPCTACCHC